jgi:hypothetical protein
MDAKPYKIPHPFKKLSKKLIDKLVNDIQQGSTHILAAESNGLTEAILSIWRKQGKIDLEHEQDTLCSYLVKSLAKVKQDEVIWCRKSTKKSDKGHKGAEWTLEHAYQKDFSNNPIIRELADDIADLKLHLLHGELKDGKEGNEMDSKNAHEKGSAS